MNKQELIEAVKGSDVLSQDDKAEVIALIKARAIDALEDTEDTLEGTDHSSAFAEGTTPEQMEAFQSQHAQSLQAYQRLAPELQAQTHFAYSEATGCWSMIGIDNSENTSSWMINPQQYILNNKPASMDWKKDRVVEHKGKGPNGEDIIHFNRKAANRYVGADSNIDFARAPNKGYNSQLVNLLSISLTSWSLDDGSLYFGRVGDCAVLWLGQRYLFVYSDVAGVHDGFHLCGHSLLLSDTSFDT